jgi:tetratricopeptide (TPR) repeat protein
MDEAADDERAHGSQPRAMGATGMVLNSASREKADAFLDAQIGLLHLEKEKLAKEDAAIDAEIALNLSHLRFRRLGDFTKFGLESATALLVLLVLIGIGAVIWAAANDHGLMIDAFRVPPDMEQKGLGGDVVASALLDHLAQLQAETDSSRAPDTFSSNWGKDIKVEIPETGISIGEGYRYLAGWLGHQTHITGEVYHTTNGIALVTRVSGFPGVRFEGREADLDALIARAAESVYGQTQPYRYAIYIGSVREDHVLGEKLLRDLATSGSDADKPWAYSVWGEAALGANDIGAALYRARKAVALAPDIPLIDYNLAQVEASAGHDEQELEAAEHAVRALAGAGADKGTVLSGLIIGLQSRETIAEEEGDYASAVAEDERILQATDYEASHMSSFFMRAANAALAHDTAGARRLLGAGTDIGMIRETFKGYGWGLANFVSPQFMTLAQRGEWQAARVSLAGTLNTPWARSRVSETEVRTQIRPWLALAEAKSGDRKAALNLIGTSPLDCYLCLRMRGNIDAVGGNWSGAAYWFARAVDAAPSIPFAYTDWGAMLLAKGDADGAIAQFERAHDKGPHFADPLEMWGEALMAKNRSDLALAKFEEADKYAPRWARLHLKWGEALFYAGKRDEAKKQFAIASGLGPSAADAQTLGKWIKTHG